MILVAELLLTLGRVFTRLGTSLYNCTSKGWKQPTRVEWDHDIPNWSEEFYAAFGRQEWERRRVKR